MALALVINVASIVVLIITCFEIFLMLALRLGILLKNAFKTLLSVISYSLKPILLYLILSNEFIILLVLIKYLFKLIRLFPFIK